MHLLVPVKGQGKRCRSIVLKEDVRSFNDAFRTQKRSAILSFMPGLKATNQFGLSRDQSDSSSMLVTAAVQIRSNAYHDRSVIA